MYPNWARIVSIARIYKNVCWTRAAQTLDTHRNMHAYLALALALAAPALGAAAALPDRLGYEREIDPLVPKLLNYVLSNDYLNSQKNKVNFETKPRPEEPIIDNVVLESNVLQVRPAKRQLERQAGGAELVRRRRGYNLENVRVPARYPYLPVVNPNRFRRWG